MKSIYSQTTTTNAPRSLTIDDLNNAIAAVNSLPKSTEWMLASPDGRVWKGEPDQLLQVLIPYHPLLKPMSLSEILGANHG